ncbi:MAG: UDP-N-acetylmuramate--L-alanine ligase [Parcubacteria group bacterium ADurb.Bin316]|nr:MAG: UDP-N-acetylmuramate--L-alanine ligase [Parcubacteria group bacterium ADurb.Bin316]HOZ56421.1 UDP-N-acetylmuramate--L-alanine ligase [bacterium]
MNLSKIKRIYMIGIKGVGMTMLAQFLVAKDIEVSGSDTKEKFMTDKVLKNSGIKVIENFSANNIPADTNLIIYSSAYNKDNNTEMQAIENLKIEKLSYAEALGQIFNNHYGIAVVGSHGKTTTTAWLGYVLEKANLAPNVLVGAMVPQFGGNALVGRSDYFVIEADEYQNKLKYYNPRVVLLNNIDYDHPDFFPTVADYNQVFIEFIEKIPSKGFLVANFDDPTIRKIANVNSRAKVISYAINEVSDYVAYDIKSFNGKEFFKVKIVVDETEDDEEAVANKELGDFSIQLIGKHNIYNALAVIATCIELNIDLVKIRKYLEEFSGTARRMEIMGEHNGAIIIDDYAHHPTEIKATLSGIEKLYPQKNKIVVFHPHTFTRTKALLNDFAKSFLDADELIILDIYGSAREIQGGVSSEELVRKIKEVNNKIKVQYIPTQKEAENYLRKQASIGDVIILMGAGDVFRIGEKLIK